MTLYDRAFKKWGSKRVPGDEDNDQSITVTPQMLRRLAGERYFDRGEAYFAEGAVQSLRRDGGSVKAVVQGTQRYRVHLRAEDGDLSHDCSCPLGRDGEFCKHCVAVGLTLHTGDPTEDDGKAFSEADLRAYLLGRNKEDLVSMLCDWAEKDERLHRDLMVRAAQATEGTASLSVWKNALDGALETGDFVHYREAYDYASGVEDVIENLEDLLRSGKADSVIEPAEYGLEAVEECMEHLDDSDGWMYGHLERLQALHLEACRKARPDPVALAERLFEGEMESSFDSYHGAALVYKEVLGEAGLAAYRRLAEADWAKVPALGPGEEDANRYGRRFRITSIMEALAEVAEDFDALVAVKSRDLSMPHAFLQIAELYDRKDDPDLALEWAERGWRAFPDRRRDERLRAFIVEAYQSRDRGDEAMELVWEPFADRPDLGSYRQLERQARRVKAWPDWRDKALAEIRKCIAGKKAEAPPDRWPWMGGPWQDHSLLVEIFLHEKDSERAWHEAEAGGCSNDLWLTLAKRREKSHPEDSLRIYKAHVTRLLKNTGNPVYEEAASYLEKIRAILNRSRQEERFRHLITEIRATQKRKRNLMKLLDRKGW